MYKFKQDLAMAYFDGCCKKTASRLLAREINLTPASSTPSKPPATAPPKNASPPANSKSSSPI